MPSSYLQPTDYANYGAPASATAGQIMQASILIDAYLGRPQGLVYVPDANGSPAYMAAANAELMLTAVTPISTGAQAVVQVTGPVQSLQIGDCVVLDRLTNATAVESVQVLQISQTGTEWFLTLGSTAADQPVGIQFNHGAGCSIETGLVITESRFMPKGLSQVLLGYVPVMRVIGGTGRYGYGRRSDANASNMDEFNLLAAINKFGGPPAWEIWPANTAAGINEQTGELWVPAGVMLTYYSEVKVRYVSGYTYNSLPSEIKVACAMLVVNLSQTNFMGNIKSYSAGDTSITRFSASNLSDDIKSMIAPWKARTFA